MLLDDLIFENDEFEERTRSEREQQHVREQRLPAAGAAIRQIAGTRMSRGEDFDDLFEDETLKEQTRRSSSSVLEHLSIYMVESVERQKESDERKLELEEKLFFGKMRAEKEQQRFNRTRFIVERKQVLQEKRFST